MLAVKFQSIIIINKYSFLFIACFGVAVDIPQCAVFIRDPEGYEMSRWIATTKLKWTLHGSWTPLNSTYICKTPDLDLFEHIAQQNYVKVQWYDATESTNHTCCQLQRHEYSKHGCKHFFSPLQYWNLICDCFHITAKQVWYPLTCRYNGTHNIINEAVTWPDSTFGCKPFSLYAYIDTEVTLPFKLHDDFGPNCTKFTV